MADGAGALPVLQHRERRGVGAQHEGTLFRPARNAQPRFQRLTRRGRRPAGFSRGCRQTASARPPVAGPNARRIGFVVQEELARDVARNGLQQQAGTCARCRCRRRNQHQPARHGSRTGEQQTHREINQPRALTRTHGQVRRPPNACGHRTKIPIGPAPRPLGLNRQPDQRPLGLRRRARYIRHRRLEQKTQIAMTDKAPGLGRVGRRWVGPSWGLTHRGGQRPRRTHQFACAPHRHSKQVGQFAQTRNHFVDPLKMNQEFIKKQTKSTTGEQ